jgi:hypothetical protein
MDAWPIVCHMPYPASFHRLVIIGTLYAEDFNTSLSIVPNALGELGMPEVDAPTLAAVADVVEDWWTAGGGLTPIQAQANVKLTGIKLNRINAAGHYEDPVTMEHVYSSPIAGTGGGVSPAQNSMVSTLATAIPRGRGSKGRMYLPPCGHIGTLGTDGRVTAAGALACAASTRSFINALNAVYTLVGSVGVASNAGAGAFNHVSEVRVGRVVDTVRSRRTSLLEDYQVVAL